MPIAGGKSQLQLNLVETGFPVSKIGAHALAIQGPGVIVSNWPDWVILLYIIGAEVSVE
jgi:hypothetical protein